MGYDPIEMRVGWRNIWSSTQRTIDVAAIPNTHSMHQSSLAFVGNIRHGLATLRKGMMRSSLWTEAETSAVRHRLASIYRMDETWGPAAIIDVARRAMPDATIATVDSGAHRILLSQTWSCYEPRALLQSSAFCTMGCSLPLGIGAKLADPGRPVAVFTGDACLEMTLGELATARDMKTAVIVIVFADASLSLIEIKQRANGQTNLGVDFPATDFAAAARALGGQGFEAASRGELEAAIKQALAEPRFSVISCKLPRRAYDGRI